MDDKKRLEQELEEEDEGDFKYYVSMEEKNLRDLQRQSENVEPDGYTIYLPGTEEFIRWFFETFDYYTKGEQFQDNYTFSFFPFKGYVNYKWYPNPKKRKDTAIIECISDQYICFSREDIHRICIEELKRYIRDLLYKKTNIEGLLWRGKEMVKYREAGIVVSIGFDFKITESFIKDNTHLVKALLHEIYMGFCVGAYDPE